MNDQPVPDADLLTREEGRAGFMTLNRPAVLNALTPGMVRTMEEHYVKWAAAPRIYGVVVEAAPGRAFCGGGDVRAVSEGAKADPKSVLGFFRDEYQLNWSLECFTKPNVALIDGICMGGGVGISIFGTHRVAGEHFRFAMPETGIGFFPDIGGGFFLSRFRGEMGVYLGLTGRSIGRADGCYLGIATHCIDAEHFPRIRAAMIESDPIDPVLDALRRDPGESELAALQDAVDRIFSASTVEEILSRLDAETGAHSDWARETAAVIRRNAPLSLKVTLRQIREARRLPRLKEALIADFRLSSRLLVLPDFHEGVRAALVDKDRSPKWHPQSLEEATDEMVDACFAPLGEGEELELADRWTLAA